MPEKEEVKKFNVKFTREELEQRVADLESDEEVILFSKVQRGAAKVQEYRQLVELLEQKK